MKHWLFLSCLALAVGPAQADDPAPLSPSTGSGLAAIETLWKAGELRLGASARFGMTNVAYTYEVAFQHPNRLAVRKHGTLVLTDGTNLTVEAHIRDLYRYATVPFTNRHQVTKFLQQEPDPLIADLAALLEPDPPNALLDTLRNQKAVAVGEETLDGHPCRVLDLELNRRRDFVMRGRVWVDQTWGVIRKMVSRWEVLPGTNTSAQIPDMNMEFILTDLRVNQPLSPMAFAYTPPAKARRMASPDRLLLYPYRHQKNESLGQPAPDFTLPLLDGTVFQLSSQTGKVVVLDFWATWCGPCVRALPEMRKLSEKFAGQEVVLVGVSSDQPEAEAKVRELVASNGLTYAIGIATNDIGDAYQVQGIPCLFVVDRAGRLQHRHVGYDPQLSEKIGGVVEQLLAGQTPEAPAPWTDEEKAALAEEEDMIKNMRRPRETITEPDTNAFLKVWRSTTQPAYAQPPSRHLVVAIEPATHTLLDDSTMIVVEAATGEIRHRVPLPAELVQADLLGQPPRHRFLSTPEGGMAVLLHVQHAYHDDGHHNHYQTTGAVVHAVSTDGTLRWSRPVPSDLSAMDVLPGPEGRERLLLSGWNHVLVLDEDGRERWRQRFNVTQMSHIEAGTEPGTWDLLMGGNNPGRYRWLEPPPPAASEEKP